jgi:DNA-binding MarR family transcriptional regulator
LVADYIGFHFDFKSIFDHALQRGLVRPESGGDRYHRDPSSNSRAMTVMLDASERAVIALRRIIRVTESHSRALARDLGTTASQVIVLRIIEHAGEAMAGQVAEQASMSQATISSLLDNLEGSGLAVRRRGKDDRRRVWVSLTPAGRAFLDSIPDLLQERFESRFRTLPAWEQGYLVAALDRITSLLDAEQIDASPVLDVGAIATEAQTETASKSKRSTPRRRTRAR